MTPAKATSAHRLTIEKRGAFLATRFGLERDLARERHQGLGQGGARKVYLLSALQQPDIDRLMAMIADQGFEHEVGR